MNPWNDHIAHRMPFTLRIKQLSDFGRIEELEFNKENISIGRDESNDLVLLNRHRVVSRLHAKIQREDAIYQLIDMGSKNATRLNGKRLETGQCYSLRDGDCFVVGDFEVEFLLTHRPFKQEGPPTSPPSQKHNLGSFLIKLLNMPLRSNESSEQQGDETGYHSFKDLVLLSELAAEISTTFDLPELAATVLHSVLAAIDAEQGVITLVNDAPVDAEQSFTRVTVPEQSPFRVSRTLLHWMKQHQRPLRLQHPPSEPPLTWPPPIQSLLAVPLIVQSRVTGVLTVYNKPKGFNDMDERLLIIIASQAAQVLENARNAPKD